MTVDFRAQWNSYREWGPSYTPFYLFPSAISRHFTVHEPGVSKCGLHKYKGNGKMPTWKDPIRSSIAITFLKQETDAKHIHCNVQVQKYEPAEQL